MNFRFANFLLAGVVAFAVAGARANVVNTVDATRQAAATSVTNALDWGTASNWSLGTVPNDANTFACLGRVTASGTYTYITSGIPVSIARIGESAFPSSSYDGIHNVYLSEFPLTLNAAGGSYVDPGESSASFHYNIGTFFYAPVVIANKSLYFKYAAFCGPVTWSGSNSVLLEDYSDLSFRFDRWAAAAGAERTNPLGADAGRVAASGAKVIVYGPESSATDVSGDYVLAAGSPYAVRVSGARHALPVGTIVTSADGAFPSGTYLKRVFPDDSIELSAPATKSVASGTLTFAAFTPEVRQTFSAIKNNGSDSMNIVLNKYRAEDTLVISTPNFEWGDTAGNLSVWTYGAYKPGVLSVCGFKNHDVESVAKANLYLYNSELEITPPQDAAAYDEYVKIYQVETTGVSVPAEKTVALKHVKQWSGTIVKRGAGLLKINSDVAANATLDIAEGRCEPTVSAASGSIALLKVRSGAELVVPEAGLTVDAASFETGAVVSGTGTLHFTSFTSLSGATIGPDVKIVIDKKYPFQKTVPAPATEATLPGDPAFWVDCTQTNKMTFVTLDTAQQQSTLGVYRIDDVRKQTESDKYLFSTNVCGSASSVMMPTLRFEPNKKLHHLYLWGQETNPSGIITGTDSHAWSRPVANIRAVFEVYAGNGPDGPSTFYPYGPNPLLGGSSTSRLAAALPDSAVLAGVDVWRGNGSSAPYFPSATDAMKAGVFTFNGVIRNQQTFKQPYGAGLHGDGTHQGTYYCHPMVVDLTIPDTYDANGKLISHVADTYAFSPSCGNRWHKRLFELIVYTNELTQAEIVSVRRYLMRKWLGQDAMDTLKALNPERIDAVGGTVEPAEDDGYYAETIAANAKFTKKGAGTVFVEEACAPAADVTVAAGTLQIQSRDLSKLAIKDDDQVTVHLDASDKKNFTYSYDKSRGVNTVTKWFDVKTTSGTKLNFKNWSATNLPFIAENKLNGLSVLDFGQFVSVVNDSNDNRNRCAGLWTENAGVRRNNHGLIAVWGSENGGGSLLGQYYSSHYWKPENGGFNAGFIRAGTHGSKASEAIFLNEGSYHPNVYNNPATYLTRMNGVSVNPNTTGLSGGFDLVSHVCWYPFELQTIMLMEASRLEAGGGQIGELLVTKIGFSPEHLDELEAYFQKKWFNKIPEGYRAASLNSVSVASGATLEVTGGGPLTVNALAVAGDATVKGDLVLAAGASLAVTVNGDGTVTPISIDGSIDLTKGGTVTFTGSPEKLQKGEYVLVENVGDTALANWTVDTTSLRKKYRRNPQVFVKEGNLCLRLSLTGVVFTVK